MDINGNKLREISEMNAKRIESEKQSKKIACETAQKMKEQVELAKAKAILTEIEYKIINTAEEGKRECTYGKIKEDVKNLSTKWAHVYQKLSELEGLKVDFQYEHDGVGMESWHSLKITW